jgi:hypothetical protein
VGAPQPLHCDPFASERMCTSPAFACVTPPPPAGESPRATARHGGGERPRPVGCAGAGVVWTWLHAFEALVRPGFLGRSPTGAVRVRAPKGFEHGSNRGHHFWIARPQAKRGGGGSESRPGTAQRKAAKQKEAGEKAAAAPQAAGNDGADGSDGRAGNGRGKRTISRPAPAEREAVGQAATQQEVGDEVAAALQVGDGSDARGGKARGKRKNSRLASAERKVATTQQQAATAALEAATGDDIGGSGGGSSSDDGMRRAASQDRLLGVTPPVGKLDAQAYTALVERCEDRPEAAFALLAEMRAARVRPNKLTLAAVVRVCAAGGELGRVSALLDQMAQRGGTAPTYVYNELMLAVTRKTRGQVGGSSGEATEATGVTAAREERQQRRARRVRVAEERAGQTGVAEELAGVCRSQRNDVGACDGDAAGRAKEASKARGEAAAAARVEADDGQGGRGAVVQKRQQDGLEAAMEVYERMRRHGRRPDAVTAECLLQAHAEHDAAAAGLALFKQQWTERAADVLTEETVVAALQAATAAAAAAAGGSKRDVTARETKAVVQAVDELLEVRTLC